MASNSGGLGGLSDEDLALECARRPVQQEAFGELFRRYRTPVVGQILGKTGPLSRSASEDLAQDVFLRLFLSLPRFDPAKSKLKTYVHVITDRVIIDFLRYGSLERALTISIDDHLRVLRVQAEEDPEVLMRTAERLAEEIEDPGKIPLVVDLLHGLDAKDVAEKHGVKPNQAYAARLLLRQILENISDSL